jgi:SAM-dependent methyltransferase
LLTRRDGDSPALRARHAQGLEVMRDGVLDRADLQPDDVLLDVGTGTGLIGFGALDRLGPGGRVIFSDLSQDLLDECRRTAGGDGRCSFVRASADDQTANADNSVDVVTTRSVLIYVDRKDVAFAEFRRVLRPGGRLSVFEPINRFVVENRPDDMFGLGASPVAELLLKVRGAFQDPRPMIDFDERDLLRWAVDAGFAAVELDYRAQLDAPAEPITDWAALKNSSPNPLAPTYGEAMAATLTAAEQERLDEYLSARAEAGTPTRRTLATVFLRAESPD